MKPIYSYELNFPFEFRASEYNSVHEIPSFKELWKYTTISVDGTPISDAEKAQHLKANGPRVRAYKEQLRQMYGFTEEVESK